MSARRVYWVTIWEVHDSENWLGPVYVETARIASVVVVARNRRQAAAKAYARALGRRRFHIARKLNAPAAVIQELGHCELNVRAIACSLKRRRTWAGPCFEKTNDLQTWHIRARRIRVRHARLVRFFAAIEARRICRRRLLYRTYSARGLS
jgi:hypothetical protein